MKEVLYNITDQKTLLMAIRTLMVGGIIVLPTDTLYGLHALAELPDKAAELARLKGYDDDDRGFILLANDLAMVEAWAVLDDSTRRIIEQHSPGAISYILPAHPETPESWITVDEKGERRIAFRIPDSEFLRNLIDMLNSPLLSTSANLAGEPTLATAGEIVKLFADKIELAVADPELEKRLAENGSVPSTLVDLSCSPPRVIREGQVPFSQGASAG